MKPLQKIQIWLEDRENLGILILRLFIGVRLLYGVIDNINSWDQMLEFASFLQSNGFPIPLVSAMLSVYVQFVAAICVLLGFRIRLAAALLVINFLVALFGFHLPAQDSIEGMTPALAMFFIALTLFFTGAGKFSLQAYLKQS